MITGFYYIYINGFISLILLSCVSKCNRIVSVSIILWRSCCAWISQKISYSLVTSEPRDSIEAFSEHIEMLSGDIHSLSNVLAPLLGSSTVLFSLLLVTSISYSTYNSLFTGKFSSFLFINHPAVLR